MIMISACLAGVDCKYNGGNNEVEHLKNLVKDREVILVCPEQLGGLTTPRSPSEIIGGQGSDVLRGNAKVVTKEGMDVTVEFVKGAQETLKIAQLYGIQKAILKARSPSCGVNTIYDGTFGTRETEGHGVTAALLIQNGIEVLNEENL